MTSQLFLSSVAIAAVVTGSAFAQTQQPAAEQQQTGQTQQQPTEQQQGTQQQAAQPAQEQVAAGECTAQMQEIAGGEYFTGEEPGYRQHVDVLATLRDAAMRLQAEGLDEACLRVVEAMQIAIQTYQEGGAPAGMATRGDFTRAQLEERVVPVDASEMPINTARLEGTDLYNFEGEDIGDVEGFLMAQGSPTHMIVSHGGFWSIGENEVAIPLDIVRWDPEWQAFFAPLTDEQLDDAPDYDEGAWNSGANDEYYQPFRG